MIIENNVKLIIMLCKTQENGKSKCHEYWPSKENETIKLDQYNVEFLSENKIGDIKNLYIRNFQIKKKKNDDESPLKVSQLHFIGWPDHGVPNVDQTYLVLEKMFITVKENMNENSPVVVHCSAGIGRTGTFISSYLNWNLINKIIDCQNYELESDKKSKIRDTELTKSIDRIEIENEKKNNKTYYEKKDEKVDIKQNGDQILDKKFSNKSNHEYYGKMSNKFSIFKSVMSIKSARCYSVENPDQYKFIYDFIHLHLKYCFKKLKH